MKPSVSSVLNADHQLHITIKLNFTYSVFKTYFHITPATLFIIQNTNC